MISRVLRDMRNRKSVAENELKRQALRYVIRNETLPQRTRIQAQLALNAFPGMARPGHVRNRCVETGRGRGVMREFRLCRFQFRLAALRGDLPGVMKSTW